MGKILTIDQNFCDQTSFTRDFRGGSITPLSVADYVCTAIRHLGVSSSQILYAIDRKWDSIYWKNSAIPINIWNRLFSGKNLSVEEWNKLLIPLDCISLIRTHYTSRNTKVLAVPVFIKGVPLTVNNLMLCSSESYNKTFVNQEVDKFTAFRFGTLYNPQEKMYKLHQDVEKVVLYLE